MTETRTESGAPAAPAAAAAPQHLRTARTGATSASDAPSGPGAPADPGRRAGASRHRISIDDFMKVELRVAKVLEAERVPKSKKLMKLSIDAGS